MTTFDDLRGATVTQATPTRDELYATIVRWLEQHYMVHWFDLCDEESILLVDVLSVPQDKDISTGEDEIHSIADTVLDALEEYLSIADARDAENARLQSERDMLLSALQRIVWNGFLDDVPTSVKDEAERVIAIASKEKE